jgi:hypothetical protein
VRSHYPTKVVRSAVTNPVGGTRSVWLGDAAREDPLGYWLHDLQFTTVEDELSRWDKVE